MSRRRWHERSFQCNTRLLELCVCDRGGFHKMCHSFQRAFGIMHTEIGSTGNRKMCFCFCALSFCLSLLYWIGIRAVATKLPFLPTLNAHIAKKNDEYFSSIKKCGEFLENVTMESMSINRQKRNHFADDGEQMLAVFFSLYPFLCVQLFFNDHLKDVYLCRQSSRFVWNPYSQYVFESIFSPLASNNTQLWGKT